MFLEYLKEANDSQVAQLLNENKADVNYIYTDLEDLNAFQILCLEIHDLEDQYIKKKEKFLKCVRLLFDRHIDLRYKNPAYNCEAIDYSLLTYDFDIFSLTLEEYKKQEISIVNKDLLSTVLYIYAKFICFEEESDDEYTDSDDGSDAEDDNINDKHIKEDSKEKLDTCIKIIKLLLQYVDVNTLDVDTGATPIYLAAKFKSELIVNALLDDNLTEIDLDYYVDKDNETARNLIIKNKFYDDHLPKNCNYHLLYQFILEKHTRSFIDEYCKTKEDEDSIKDSKKKSFLLRAVHQGADEIVSYMVNETENILDDFQDILRTACSRGFHHIVQILLNNYDIDYGVHIIKLLIEKRHQSSNPNTAVDYAQCLEVLLGNKDTMWKHIHLNKIDSEHKTILQNAIECKQFKMIQILLRNGTSLVLSKYEIFV